MFRLIFYVSEVAVLFGILTVSLQYFVPILVMVFTYIGKGHARNNLIKLSTRQNEIYLFLG